MDSSRLAIAAGALLVGLWLSSGKGEPDTRPCVCHCAVPAPERGHQEGWLWLAGGGNLVLLAANLALAFRVSIRRDEAGVQEFTLSVKAGQGRVRGSEGTADPPISSVAVGHDAGW